MSWRLSAYFASSVLAVSFAVGLVKAATIATWDGATANWTDPTHWSTAPSFPNNSGPTTYDAVVNAGAVSVNQAIAIDRLNLSGGALDGASSLSAATGLTWTGGTIRGAGSLSLASGATSTITAATPLNFSARTVNNAGSVTFSSGAIFGGAGATLNNQTGGNFTVLNGANFFANAASPLYTISNAGTFTARSTAGNGFTTIDASFVNTGTLRVENTGSSHTLSLAGGSNLGATVDIAANGAIELGGATTLQAGTNITGPGTVVVAGQVVLAGSISAQNLTVANGELNVGSRTVSVASSAIQNGGTIHLAGGIMRVAAGAGTLLMNDGTLFGSGTLDSSLQAFGLIAPGETTGDLTVTGTVSLQSEARLQIQLAGTGLGQFDRLLLNAGAALDGTLDLQLVNGFVPSNSDVFTILIAGTGRTGAFSNAPVRGRIPVSPGIGSFQIDYTSDAVVLSGFIIPEPGTAAMLLAGLLFVSAARHPKPSRARRRDLDEADKVPL